MNDLELLGQALREELGSPPHGWLSDQRVRFVAELERRRTVPRFYRLAPVVAGVLAVAGVLVWMATRKPPSNVARSLVGTEMREPFRFDDGSTLALARGAVGRLVVDETSVRFELESGSVSFDVVPGQRRVWLVTAGENEVRVVGTRFSVAYSPSRAFDVEVERGVVSVRRSDRTRVELQAGQGLHDRPRPAEVSHAGASTPPDTASNERATTDAASSEPDSIDPANEREPLAESERNPEWRAQYRVGHYAESLALIRAEGLDDRLNEVHARTLAEVADAARLGGDPELAVRALLALMRRFPRAAEARDGKFLLGRVYALRGDAAAAISAFETYLKPGGSTRYENEAVGRLIGLYSARGDGELARGMASRYLRQAPDGPYRRLANSLVQRRR